MWQNVKIDLVCRFRCLGMQVSSFRYANMDFFETPHIQIRFLWKDPVFKYEFLVLFIYPWSRNQLLSKKSHDEDFSKERGQGDSVFRTPEEDGDLRGRGEVKLKENYHTADSFLPNPNSSCFSNFTVRVPMQHQKQKAVFPILQTGSFL